MAYTPKPWIVQWPKFDADVVIEGGLHIARVRIDDAERPEGNAHLIAAAPDLYEACKAIVEVSMKFSVHQQFAEGIVAARKALARAEGREGA